MCGTLNAFDEHQMLIHQAIADSIGPVVEKAFRIEMLTKANKDYGEVLSFISHELQSPVASMVTDARLMAAGYLGELNEKQKEKLGRTIHKGEYLLRMIREFLNLARLEEGSLKAHMAKGVDLNEQVVQPIELRCWKRNSMPTQWLSSAILNTDYRPSNVTLDSCKSPSAICFATRSPTGEKAAPYGSRSSGKNGSKDRSASRSGTKVPGFSEAQRSQLFRKFSRLDDPELKKKKGTGIGLYSTWRIMQLHHGHATARSEQGKWAEFKLSLPTKNAHAV